MKWPVIMVGATIPQLQEALNLVQPHFNNNLVITDAATIRDGYKFYLSVADFQGNGASKSEHGRRQSSACWHAHHELFERLLDLVPEVRLIWPEERCLLDRATRGRMLWRDFASSNQFGDWDYRASQLCYCSHWNAQLHRVNNHDLVVIPRPPERDQQRGRPLATLPTINPSECIQVQLLGADACKECMAHNTSACGGRAILRLGRNRLGATIPLGPVK